MEAGVVRTPLPSYVAITPETRAPNRNKPAAETELPASQTVKPSAESAHARGAATERSGAFERHAQSAAKDLVRKNMLDPESESLIYVAMDRESGEVVRQVPSETLRKLRAYAKAVTEQSPGPTQTLIRTA